MSGAAVGGTGGNGSDASASLPVGAPPDRRWVLAVVLAVARRPGLWATAVVTGLRLARPGWWRRPPFLPLPDPHYLRFRLQTMYGGDGRVVGAPDDVLAYLRWCRRTRRP